MKIHKEGRKIVLVAGIVTAILVAGAFLLFPAHHWLYYAVPAFLILFCLGIVWFFRSPRRHINKKADAYLSPADGTIVAAEQSVEETFFGRPMTKVSIFMSPLNVHLNRYPADGKVISYQYHPGKYLVAWHPKSSKLNERNSIVMQTATGQQIMLSQIAGTIARRIVCYSKEGIQVKQGDELGFIKFGSRVDLYLPLDVTLLVGPGDKVKAGINVLAQNGSSSRDNV